MAVRNVQSAAGFRFGCSSDHDRDGREARQVGEQRHLAEPGQNDAVRLLPGERRRTEVI